MIPGCYKASPYSATHVIVVCYDSIYVRRRITEAHESCVIASFSTPQRQHFMFYSWDAWWRKWWCVTFNNVTIYDGRCSRNKTVPQSCSLIFFLECFLVKSLYLLSCCHHVSLIGTGVSEWWNQCCDWLRLNLLITTCSDLLFSTSSGTCKNQNSRCIWRCPLVMALFWVK